jgi:hypothetical protein
MKKLLIPLLLAIGLLPQLTEAQTPCSGFTPVPYSTGFEGLSTADMPACWWQVASGSSSASTFPSAYAYANNARNGGVYFEFESSSGQTEIAALPEMDDINQLMLTFYASVMNVNFMLEAGVMEDSTFVPVDTVQLTAGSGGNWHGSYYPYTVFFNNYSGSGSRLALRVTASGSYTLMLDDLTVDYVPNCLPPTNLTVDSVSVDWIALHWTEIGTATSWVVEYSTTPIADSLLGTGIGTVQNVTGTPATTLNLLDTATGYYIYVYSDCGEYSAAISTQAATLSGLPATVPYFCDFEQAGPNGWELLNNNQTNKWVVDSATSNGGSRSLYVSDNNGVSNNYTITSSSYSFAVRTITLPTAGEYSYSFDWKMAGEGCCDFIRAALVPVSTDITAGSYCGFSSTNGVPAGGIALDGSYRLNQQSSWTTQSGTFILTTPGTYNIVFLWRNDGSVGTQPPAAIDNVSLRINTCPTPYGLTASNVIPTEVTLAWHVIGTESEWQITYGDQVETAYDSTVTIYGLTPDTTYQFRLRAVCGDDDTSNAISIIVTTPPSCPAPTDFSVLSTGGDWVEFGWHTGYQETQWQLAYGSNGFVPDENSTIVDLYDTVYTLTGLSSDSTYSVYLRADCGGEYSSWVSLSGIMPGAFVMTHSTDTLRACGAVIFDNGGPDGDYSNSLNQTLVVMSPSPDSTLRIWGTLSSESNWDYLSIFDGIGTSGTQLYEASGENLTVGPFVSTTGAFTIRFTSDGSGTRSGFELHTLCEYLSSCAQPINVAVDSVFGDTVYLSWHDTAMVGTYEIAYGSRGFSPDSAENIVNVWGDSTYMFTGLPVGVDFDFYVRADCGSEPSNWSGPASATTGWIYIMSTSGTDTIRGCGYTIYDNGGPDGDYSNSCEATVVVFPSSPDSLFQIQGTLNSESGWDFLTIYDGVGTSGTQLYRQSGSNLVVGPFVSTTGAFTINFHSDGSTVRSGFELLTTCMAPPQCAEVLDVAVRPGVTSALLTWNEGQFGTYNGAMIEYREAGDSVWIPGITTTDHYGALTGLDTLTAYVARVIATCDEGNANPVEIEFTTNQYGCAEIDTVNSVSDTIGNGTGTSNYLPSYSTYNYGLSQQVYTAAEIGHGGMLTAISIMPQTIAQQRTYEIYLAHTSQTSLSGFIHPSDMVRVYDGAPLTLTADQWVTFQLDSPFMYNGSDNLLVCFRDMTGAWVSGNYWYAHTPGQNSVYAYQDGGAYDPFTTTGGTTTSSRNNMIFDFLACAQQSTCPAPVAQVMEVDATSVTVAWAPGDVETSWDLYYRLVGDTSYTLAGTTSNLSYTFTGLFSSSEYEFMIQAPCAGSNDGAAYVSASTTCGRSPLPYTEDFEAYSGTFSRRCWYTGTTNLGTTYPNPTVVSLTGDPNKLLLLYNGAYVILPEMDAPLNQLQIRFNFVQGGDNVRLIMGIMDNPTAPIDSIRVIDTLIRSNMDSTTAYVYVTYPLDGIADTAGHLAFWDAFNDNYSFLDNIVIEYIPNCSNVTEITAGNTTATTADVSWAGVSSATGYIVEYGPRGFVPGTGTTVSVTGTSTTITGLASGISYDAYVYAVCGASNDTSIALSNVRFTTQCGVYNALPYVQNFEGIVDPGDASTNIVPNCWVSKVLPTGSGNQPHVAYITNVSQAPSQQYCFYFEGVGIAALPEMATPLDSLRISFHLWNGDPSQYGLIIGAVDNADSNFEASFQPIDTIPFYGVGNEFNVESYLNGYTGNSNRIAIASYNVAGNATAYHYIDNLVVDRAPNCIAPQRVRTTFLTDTAATLAWTFSNAPNYSIEYGVHGFTPGTGTTVTSTANSVTLIGLTAYTQYDVYLVSQCSATETSDTTLFTFTTLRSGPVTTLPYLCTFADSAIALGWEPVNGSQTNKWHVGTAAHFGTADNYAMYISNDNGTSNSYSINSSSFVYAYRTFIFAAGTYTISYNWQAYGESTWDYLRAWLAPGDVDFTAGQLPDGTTSTNTYSSTTPAGWIPLDGGSHLNLQSSWQTRIDDATITTPGAYHLVFMWANDGGGGSNPPVAIDNVEVYLNPCAAPQNIFATSVGTTTIDLDWVDIAPAISWQVEYGPQGYSLGTGTLMNVVSHPVTVTGLDTLTTYDFYVRPICSANDTGRWSVTATFGTSLCDNATTVATGSESSPNTTYYAPVNNYYRYTLSETIVDSAEIGGPMDIEYIAYYYDYSSPTTDKTNCTIYFQPTAKTVFANSSDVVALDSATGVKVYEGPLNCTQGWNFFQLDTVYSYDGNGNLMIIVDDNSNDYNSLSYVFRSQPCTGNKTLYYYSDSYDPDVTNPSGFSGSKGVASWRTAMQLLSCGSVGCPRPVITSVSHTYESATITWSGSGANYEVNIKESAAANWPATDIAVTGNSYTFNGLQPATYYTFRVRKDCSADSLGYSEWTSDAVLTDSLPCLPPTNLHATAVTNATATLDWTPFGVETAWDIHVWFTGGLDSIYTVTTRPATIGGFAAGLTYNAAIRPLCGSAHNILGDWSDTITFATATCPDVTGLTASNVSANSVTLSWTADPMAQSWTIEYGFRGFDQGTGTTVNVTSNSYVVTGLLDDTEYEFYVRAVCGTGWISENLARTTATTQIGEVICDAPTGITTSVADNAITVNWTAGEGNISFEIEYGPHGFTHGSGITTSATTSPATLANLEYETQYDIYVRAICDQNTYSNWSIMATATTGQRPSDDCDPVTNLLVEEITDTSATITWTPAEGTSSWHVVVADPQGNDITDVIWDEPAIGIIGLTPGTNYMVKVRTKCDDDNYSAFVSTNFRTTGGQGINDVTSASCTIYPNPTSSSTTISVSGVNGKVKIAVVDMNGRTVASDILECSADCTKTFDVNRLAQGAYFVRITGDNVNMVKKLIVR